LMTLISLIGPRSNEPTIAPKAGFEEVVTIELSISLMTTPGDNWLNVMSYSPGRYSRCILKLFMKKIIFRGETMREQKSTNLGNQT
jgi:hypothetical protein